MILFVWRVSGRRPVVPTVIVISGTQRRVLAMNTRAMARPDVKWCGFTLGCPGDSRQRSDMIVVWNGDELWPGGNVPFHRSIAMRRCGWWSKHRVRSRWSHVSLVSSRGPLGNWVNTHRRNHPVEERPLDVPDRARLKELERENRELRSQNEFLKKGVPRTREAA